VDYFIITKSELGSTAYSETLVINQNPKVIEVSDVTGAGDTFLAVATLALSGDLPLGTASEYANIAAGKAVSFLGTYHISIDELNLLVSQNERQSKVVNDRTQVINQINILKKQGKRIGFTNGCFDILHAGHVKLLTEVKSKVDFLVLGLNSDESISKLKGPSRPVNPFSSRAEVLSALESVDLVVEFSEPTPEKLIREIQPNLLAKGGDYKLDEIVGAKIVKEYGGEVLIVNLLPGVSTTKILSGNRNEA
jgi:D-beta-D-heptose 7-phosphate kinase/D-beta-D-heptose 1-phosphate adenosyltransferase